MLNMMLKVCFFFANKQTGQINNPHGLRMETNFFLGKSKQTKQKSKQTKQAKRIVCHCSHESRDQDIGALKNNQTKIGTMYFFSNWFVWFAWFVNKKETHPE